MTKNMLCGHEKNFNEVKNLTTQSMFFDHNGIKPEISNRKKADKPVWGLQNTCLNNTFVKEEVLRVITNISS